MELNKDHRTALLVALESAKLDHKRAKAHYAKTSTEPDMSSSLEVDIYLAEQRVDIIETAIINNELYNF